MLSKGVSDFTVMSYKNGEVVECKAHDLRCTREDAELVEVEFEDGLKIRCTPDHKFLLSSGEWKEIKNITEEDDIVAI